MSKRPYIIVGACGTFAILLWLFDPHFKQATQPDPCQLEEVVRAQDYLECSMSSGCELSGNLWTWTKDRMRKYPQCFKQEN